MIRLILPVGIVAPARINTPSAASKRSSARRPVFAETNKTGESGKKKSSRRTAARNLDLNSSSSSNPLIASARKAAFAKSHLLTTTTIPQPIKANSPANCLSMRVTPCCASNTKNTTSVSAKISSERICEKKSKVSRLLAVRRPAVSTKANSVLDPSDLTRIKRERTGSRVVPAISLTMRREFPMRRLPMELFPTLGRPAKAKRIGCEVSVLGVTGAGPIFLRISVLNCGIPRPCSAETNKGSPKPRV